MNNQRLACCYFPTTTLFVDDNVNFLESLKNTLNRNLAYCFFDNPKKALKYIISKPKPSAFVDKWISCVNAQDIELDKHPKFNHSFIDIDISAIHKKIYSPKRFDEVSVIVIDHDMPKMSGWKLCEKLQELRKNIPIKLLMLTGRASYNLGVDALNKGLINKFITKQGPSELKDQLNTAIYDLQMQYFEDIYKPITQSFASDHNCCLLDPVFIDIFYKTRQKHNIVEYYLINNRCCFLMLDIYGNPKWFIVQSEKDMQEALYCVEDNEAPADIIQNIKERKSLLFFFSNQDKNIRRNEQWKNYVHAVKKFTCKNNTYYYACIEGQQTLYYLDMDKIASYRKYLETA